MAYVWVLSGNLRSFWRNYQRGGFALLSVTATELSASRAEVALSSSSTGAFSIAESIRFVRPEASLDAQAATKALPERIIRP